MNPSEQDFVGLLEVFSELEDPRSRQCPHRLDELLLAAMCAITSGAEGWVEVEVWSRIRLEWLRKYLPYANGIASHDTFSRVFSLLNAKVFERCFMNWMSGLVGGLNGTVIPIDGKSVRRSHNGNQSMVHLVSAWHTSAGVMLGQIKTAEKSNEITAIPELLDALDIKGATITIDAMGCQHDIVEKIIAKQANYMIAVKGNQLTLAESIKDWFDAVEAGTLDRPFWEHTSIDKDHGRIDTRRCVTTSDVDWLKTQGCDWMGLQSLVMIESTREFINGKHCGQRSTERRYYISSLPAQAQEQNQIVRAHWGIENGLHWVLDVVFKEDDCRIRVGDGAENFAILRRIALNILKQDTTVKAGVAARRKKAGWDGEYLQHLLKINPRS